jgi:hypothetical protein
MVSEYLWPESFQLKGSDGERVCLQTRRFYGTDCSSVSYIQRKIFLMLIYYFIYYFVYYFY